MAQNTVLQDGTVVSGAPVSDAADAARSAFVSRVYGLMFLTMVAASGASAFAFDAALLPFTKFLAGHWFIAILMYYGLAFGVHAISRVPFLGAAALIGFGVFTGLWIAPMVHYYASANPSAITSALVGTAGIFGTMSVIGAFTKRDLSGLGGFLLPGVIVAIVLSLLNVFVFGSPLLSTALSAVIVLIFAGYVAYNTQNVMTRYPLDAHVSAAAQLYLDVFIIFIHLLSLFGNRR
jgi:modulator of FtsH protease